MTEDESWNQAIKGVKRLITNRHVEEIISKDIEFRRDKETTVTFDVLKNGRSIKKDDLSQMDGSLAKRFKREEFRVEASLDLHGVTEKDAYDDVIGFIKKAYQSSKRCVLIITGKGWDNKPFSGKGVLRKAVPEWLSKSEIAPLILAFKNPSEQMGGNGALYILLRKKNKKFFAIITR